MKSCENTAGPLVEAEFVLGRLRTKWIGPNHTHTFASGAPDVASVTTPWMIVVRLNAATGTELKRMPAIASMAMPKRRSVRCMNVLPPAGDATRWCHEG